MVVQIAVTIAPVTVVSLDDAVVVAPGDSKNA